MRIVSKNAEASLAAVRTLSETAINNPPRKNHFTDLIPLKLERAPNSESPPLPEARRERRTARTTLLFAE